MQEPCHKENDFMDPMKHRYIVIAIDPAAGGELSDEAFVVFMTCGQRNHGSHREIHVKWCDA